MEKKDYKEYLKDNITKTYKKSTNPKINRVKLDLKNDCRQTVNKW